MPNNLYYINLNAYLDSRIFVGTQENFPTIEYKEVKAVFSSLHLSINHVAFKMKNMQVHFV